jgi:hypothetical protein
MGIFEKKIPLNPPRGGLFLKNRRKKIDLNILKN